MHYKDTKKIPNHQISTPAGMQKIVKKTEKITPFSSRFIDRVLPGKLHSPTLSALVDDDGFLFTSKGPWIGASFVDQDYFLPSTDGVAFRDPIVSLVHMAADGFVERIKP